MATVCDNGNEGNEATAAEGAGGRGQRAAVCGRNASGNGVRSQQRQRRGQATVAVAEAARGQTSINHKVAAIIAICHFYYSHVERVTS